MVLTPMLHRDPNIWGEDAEAFDPERFTQDAEQTRPATPTSRSGPASAPALGASSPCWRRRWSWG